MIRRLLRAMLPLLLIACLFGGAAHGETLGPGDVSVVTGDTIAVGGRTVHLVGFDAPELGKHAHCGLERMLAARAASRLRQIVRNATRIELQVVDCVCPAGTEGTRWCNVGRACGYLEADGQDVGATLAAEQLAHPLECGPFSCPPRQAWCPFVPAQ